MIVVPGTVVVWVPFELSGDWGFQAPLLGLSLTRWLGLALIIVGLPIFADFAVRFVRDGFGTPAPPWRLREGSW